MKCANPNCQNHLHYLRGGSLRLLELESMPGASHPDEGGGFPISSRTARYFWLCRECSATLVLRRWTQGGLVLQSRTRPSGAPPLLWTVPPEPAVDADSVLHFRRSVARSA